LPGWHADTIGSSHHTRADGARYLTTPKVPGR
jgi:hypothetical protein